MDLNTLAAFFGWCTIVNGGLLILTTLALMGMRSSIQGIHSRMFGLEEAAIAAIYFKYLAYFKIAVIVFNLTPYIALRIIA